MFSQVTLRGAMHLNCTALKYTYTQNIAQNIHVLFTISSTLTMPVI